MTLNTHPEDRKVMATAISEQLGLSAEYMRIPTYAYRIGEVTVNRDGTTESENSELLEQLKPMLIENGWLDAEESEPAPEKTEETISEPIDLSGIMLWVPMTDMTDENTKNLIRILYTKQKLFNRMLRLENGIIITPEAIENIDGDLKALFTQHMITGFSIQDEQLGVYIPCDAEDRTTRWEDAGTLLVAIIKAAKEAKRVHAEIQELEDHEKYLANAWLNRLGFGGPEHKDLRRRLMHHLNGYAAFRTNDRMLAHREKLAEKRHANRNNNEEVHEDE